MCGATLIVQLFNLSGAEGPGLELRLLVVVAIAVEVILSVF